MRFLRPFAASLLSSLIFLSPLALADEAAPAPIDLSEAIRRALALNYSIQVSGFDASIAAAGVQQALGKFDPVLAAEINQARSEDPQLVDIGTGIRPPATVSESTDYDLSLRGQLPWGMTYSLGASSLNSRGTFNLFADNYQTFGGVSATQPLLRNFGFGPTLATIRIAQTNRSIGEWEFKGAVIDTITRVVFAYNELNFAKAILRSAHRSRELAASLVDENEKRFKVSSMSEYDVETARSRLANREEAILIAVRRVRDAENLLKQLISDTRTPELLAAPIDIQPAPLPPVVVVDAAADFQVALANRPDYRQAQLSLKRDDINFRLQRNQLLPRVDLVGSYGYAGYDADFGGSRRQVTDRDNLAYSYGVAVSIPLTFTAERARYRAAKLTRRQSETELRRIEQDIVVRVGNAAGQIETTQRRIEAAKRARLLAQQTLDAELKRLRAGRSSTFFVLQQQEILSSLEVSESRAQTDYLNALAEYDRQLGLTLDRRNISIAPPK